MGEPLVLVITGLRAEAQLLAGTACHCITRYGGGAVLGSDTEGAAPSRFRAVISFGLCGGIAPGLKAGDLVLADSVATPDGLLQPAPEAHRFLASLLPDARSGVIVAAESPMATVAAKRQVHAATGAIAVDMESAGAARLAIDWGVPFAAIRAVCDGPDDPLPPAAIGALAPDGTLRLGAVIADLLRQPSQLGGLISTGLRTRAAIATLRRTRPALEQYFASP